LLCISSGRFETGKKVFYPLLTAESRATHGNSIGPAGAVVKDPDIEGGLQTEIEGLAIGLLATLEYVEALA
jgi:hypothetical protein